MRLTQEELQAHGLDLRTFTHELQLAGRAQPVPKFALKGPIQLAARMRPRGTAPAEYAIHSFMGGEQFTLGAVATNESGQDGAIEIKLLMTAASVELAKAGVTSCNVPMEFAMEHFEGMERLVLSCTANSMRNKELPLPTFAPPPPAKPTASQDARRGSW